MQDDTAIVKPQQLEAIMRDTAALGFGIASEPLTGALLRTLAASKPQGRFLELGTGTGVATAWLLDGMDSASTLLTVDSDPAVVAIARGHLGHDARVRFHVSAGDVFLASLAGKGTFDLIFADTWPGKYDHLEDALALLKRGGLYVIDDMLPQPSWPDGHAAKVPALIRRLEAHPDLVLAKMGWATGIIIAAKR
ncbi:MAG: class I SAM-dependent methyltransferase [Tepidisphaeraceae bacterium]